MSQVLVPIIAVTFVTAAAVVGCHHDTTTRSASPPSTVPTTRRAVAAPTAGTTPVTFPITDNLVTLDGKARSVETTGALVHLSSLHMAGLPTATMQGHFVDHAGVDHGAGTLTASGSDVTLAAEGITLAARVRVQSGSVVINPGDRGYTASAAGPFTITASHLTFQPQSGPVTPGPTTSVPPPVVVPSPVVMASTAAQLSGAGLRFVDAPTDIEVSSSEADLSWAGTGSIATSGGPLKAGYLGVRAQQLAVSLHRSAAGVDVHGTGLALQAFADGVPQLRTPARIDVLGNHATTGFLGRRRAFVWTPRNLGSTYDMAILSVHPATAAAGSVHLGLLPMPAMFGGEPHALVGGDTRGLKSGAAIDSLISRNGDDKRSIGYDTPPGSQIVLIVEGNFDPITVTVAT